MYEEKFINHLLEAKKEAIKRDIQANIIFINNNIGYSHFLNTPIILGMKIEYTDELPDNVNFALGYSCYVQDYEAEIRELKKYIKQLKGTIKGLERKLKNE